MDGQVLTDYHEAERKPATVGTHMSMLGKPFYSFTTTWISFKIKEYLSWILKRDPIQKCVIHANTSSHAYAIVFINIYHYYCN